MTEQEKGKSRIDQIPSQTLDLMLDLVLEVMQAEKGSIMLLDDQGEELTISSARGLESEIIHKARVPLGSGVSGTVVCRVRHVFLRVSIYHVIDTLQVPDPA